MSTPSTAARLWAALDTPAARTFFLSIAALTVALLLALYSGAAGELGQLGLAAGSALGALAVAAWVGVTLVPKLAKRTALRWVGQKIEFKITKAGWIYIGGTLLVALAALNTGNNLLFLILACLVSVILMSGILSSVSLAGVALRLDLPEHVFAEQPVRAIVEIENEKLTVPSFSLRVEAVIPKNAPPSAILQTPIYFPYIPKQEVARQGIPVTFSRRGMHLQDAFRIATRFPFGFLQKARVLPLKKQVLVYPSVIPTADFAEILPGIEGSLESMSKGVGEDLYALRDYVPTDSARHVHWKASARSGSLKVREFTREEDCRVLLVFDPHLTRGAKIPSGGKLEESFERAVTLCAGIAWHFFERNAQLQFRSVEIETALLPAEETIFEILRFLATVEPLAYDARQSMIQELASAPELFKIIITSQPRGSVPASLWHSSYVVFLDDYLKTDQI